MKIGVIGTFIRDRIFPWKGNEGRSIGGIFFTVSYLANLLDTSAEIYPVCFVGEDLYEEVTCKLSDYYNVRFDGIVKLPRKNTQVKLTYTGPQERDEVTTQPMPPLNLEQLKVMKDVDAVIVNLITGTDVSLQALREFRQISNALIYLDFHSRALGINEQGKRYYRRPDDWQEWISQVDILQLNEMEARTLAGHSKELPIEILVEFGKKIVSMGPSVCHVTLADKGSYLCYLHERKFKVKRLKAIFVRDVVDIIGCGDAFQAAYVVKTLSGANEMEATAFAHKVAAANCMFLGSSGIKEIASLIQQFQK